MWRNHVAVTQTVWLSDGQERAAHPAFASDKEYLETVYNRMMAAIASKNTEGYMAFVDPEAVFIDAKETRRTRKPYARNSLRSSPRYATSVQT
jgi:hypothetical protein